MSDDNRKSFFCGAFFSMERCSRDNRKTFFSGVEMCKTNSVFKKQRISAKFRQIFVKTQQNSAKNYKISGKIVIFGKILVNFLQKIEIWERCKGVYRVDLGETFPTNIWLQLLASIQTRTSLVKFSGTSPTTDRATTTFLLLSNTRQHRRIVGGVRLCWMPAEPARGRTARSLHSWLAFLSGDDNNFNPVES